MNNLYDLTFFGIINFFFDVNVVKIDVTRFFLNFAHVPVPFSWFFKISILMFCVSAFDNVLALMAIQNCIIVLQMLQLSVFIHNFYATAIFSFIDNPTTQWVQIEARSVVVLCLDGRIRKLWPHITLGGSIRLSVDYWIRIVMFLFASCCRIEFSFFVVRHLIVLLFLIHIKIGLSILFFLLRVYKPFVSTSISIEININILIEIWIIGVLTKIRTFLVTVVEIRILQTIYPVDRAFVVFWSSDPLCLRGWARIANNDLVFRAFGILTSLWQLLLRLVFNYVIGIDFINFGLESDTV